MLLLKAQNSSKLKKSGDTTQVLRWEPPYTGVSTPPGPEIPKTSQKGLPGPPGPECQKSVEKVPERSFLSPFWLFFGFWGPFRHFFGTPGREAREHPFETFWGFWGQRASGLLYMAVPIAAQVFLIRFRFSEGSFFSESLPITKRTNALFIKQACLSLCREQI